MNAINSNPLIYEKLTHLNLSGNKFTITPDLSKCTALKILQIYASLITTPPNVTNCVALMHLELDGSYLLTPPDVSKCAVLKTLKMSGSEILLAPNISHCLKLSLCIFFNKNFTDVGYVLLKRQFSDLEVKKQAANEHSLHYQVDQDKLIIGEKILTADMLKEHFHTCFKLFVQSPECIDLANFYHNLI